MQERCVLTVYTTKKLLGRPFTSLAASAAGHQARQSTNVAMNFRRVEASPSGMQRQRARTRLITDKKWMNDRRSSGGGDREFPRTKQEKKRGSISTSPYGEQVVRKRRDDRGVLGSGHRAIRTGNKIDQALLKDKTQGYEERQVKPH